VKGGKKVKNKILSLVITALIFISISGISTVKEVDKESVKITQSQTITTFQLPFQH
jgi:hypothetical protein